MIAFLSGQSGRDVEAVERALTFRQGVLPPVVVTELLSDPTLRVEVTRFIRALPALEVHVGYWERAGELRSKLLGRGLKARLADSLIAQSCLDHETALVTRDRDFRNFARWANLQLE
jgi:predicted nucleic acid-binding protein